MNFLRITYSREDILRLKNTNIHSYEIVNSVVHQDLASVNLNKGLTPRKTKRGHRSRKHRHRKQLKRGVNRNNLIYIKAKSNNKERKSCYLPALLYTNCRSINTWKLEELTVYTNIHKPDIICLTETWLNSIKQECIHINGYNAHFVNRLDRSGGGVAILCNTNLHVKVLSTHTTTKLSALWILVNSFIPIIIACIYHPPTESNITTLEYISSTLIDLTETHKKAKIIITGDFNRLDLSNISQQYGLKNLVKFNTRKDALLDLILTDITYYQQAIKLAPLATNDHNTILLERKSIKQHTYTKTVRRLYTEDRKHQVLAEIAKINWNCVLSAPSVHEKASILQQVVRDIVDKHCPFKTIKVRMDKPPWITDRICKLIRARDKAYRKGCASWKVIKHFVQRTIRSEKRKYIKAKLNDNLNVKAWWQCLNNILGKSKSKQETCMFSNNSSTSPMNLCEQLNNYFISIGRPSSTTTPPPCTPNNDCLQELSIGEIKFMLKQLDTSKATNTEDFPIWISKCGSEDICVPFQDIINTMFKTCEFPNIWKRAQIKPIAKVKNPTQPSDYRPISLLFHLGKVAEQTILNKMTDQINNSVTKNQFAYRHYGSTTDALLQLIDDCTRLLDDPAINGIQCACLDFSKAFDKMDHSILIHKLATYKFNSGIINLIQSFLNNRLQCVKIKDTTSCYKSITTGTPQGTKLGPMLWIIYINDLELPHTYTMKYADDTTLYIPLNGDTTHSITTSINQAHEWSIKNNMLLNESKTVVINISGSRKNTADFPPVYNPNGQVIEPSDTARLLGVIIDTKLNFTAHVKETIKKCNSRIHQMKKLKAFGMNQKGLLIYYKSNIRSLLTNATPAWYSLLTDENRELLDKVQQAATRVISPDLDYENRLSYLNLSKLEAFIEQQSVNHFYKIWTNDSHNLYERLCFNNDRKSKRINKVFRVPKCKTSKRQCSFFIKHMSKF